MKPSDYTTTGLVLQMQRDADLETALRCSRAVNVLVLLTVVLAVVPGLGLILGLGMMGLMMVVATALSIVTIAKGRMVRGLLDLLAVWLVVPLVVVGLQWAGVTWLARQAQDARRAAAAMNQQRREPPAKSEARNAPTEPVAPPAKSEARNAPTEPVAPPAPEDPRLWSLREKVVNHYRAKGYSVQDSVKARFVTVKMSAIQGASLKDYQLEALAAEGAKIWRAEDEGFFTVLITDTAGQYLASADPLGTKTLR